MHDGGAVPGKPDGGGCRNADTADKDATYGAKKKMIKMAGTEWIGQFPLFVYHDMR